MCVNLDTLSGTCYRNTNLFSDHTYVWLIKKHLTLFKLVVHLPIKLAYKTTPLTLNVFIRLAKRFVFVPQKLLHPTNRPLLALSVGCSVWQCVADRVRACDERVCVQIPTPNTGCFRIKICDIARVYYIRYWSWFASWISSLGTVKGNGCVCMDLARQLRTARTRNLPAGFGVVLIGSAMRYDVHDGVCVSFRLCQRHEHPCFCRMVHRICSYLSVGNVALRSWENSPSSTVKWQIFSRVIEFTMCYFRDYTFATLVLQHTPKSPCAMHKPEITVFNMFFLAVVGALTLESCFANCGKPFQFVD